LTSFSYNASPVLTSVPPVCSALHPFSRLLLVSKHFPLCVASQFGSCSSSPSPANPPRWIFDRGIHHAFRHYSLRLAQFTLLAFQFLVVEPALPPSIFRTIVKNSTVPPLPPRLRRPPVTPFSSCFFFEGFRSSIHTHLSGCFGGLSPPLHLLLAPTPSRRSKMFPPCSEHRSRLETVPSRVELFSSFSPPAPYPGSTILPLNYRSKFSTLPLFFFFFLPC